MELAEYDEFVIQGESDKVPDDLRITWAVLGLVAEAGECAEVIEKAIRKKGYIDADEDFRLLDELGDVLWYLTACANEAGFSLEQVLENNVRKLEERNAR